MRVLRPTFSGKLDKIMATRKRHSPEQIVRKLLIGTTERRADPLTKH